MNARVLPWSYTSLDSYLTCPRRHKLVRITKAVADPPGEHLKHGREVHKAIEHAIKGQQPLPHKYQSYWPLVQKCLQAPGAKIVEEQWAITENFRPTGYWDPDAWVRLSIDFGVIDGDTATIIDWKTGKPKPDADQMRLYAAATFTLKPQVQTVRTAYAWLAHDKLTVESFTREQLGELWGDFLISVKRLVAAAHNDDFPPRPSGLCRNYCPVPKALCEFSGRA